MQEFIIEGGHPIGGKITAQGNKNEALPILGAALLNPKFSVVRNIPDIEDIKNLLSILEFVGAKIETLQKADEQNSLALKVHTENIASGQLPPDLTSFIRGSVTLMAPLLARTGEVYLPKPGGDKIGRRRIDTHLLALQQLGADVQIFREGYRLKAKQLKGKEILLDEASVTGTENAIIAASVAKGKTIIENAASEPHVQGVARFMQSMGVEIDGIGSNMLHIRGVEHYTNLKETEHDIGPDYLEIGSFIAMAALTNGELTVENVLPKDLRMIRHLFERLGITFDYVPQTNEQGITQTNLFVPAGQTLNIHTDAHGEIIKIEDAPWPAFPADLISIVLVAATQCNGTVLIHEKLFESRLYFTDKLIGMGAKIVLCDPHRAVVIGPSPLHAAKVSSPDIRAGMAMVIAALAAAGTSTIQNVIQIDRGYQNIDERLKKLGAYIERVKAK